MSRALFTAGSLVCQNYLWGEDYEQAMNEAIRQVNLANREHQEYGQARGNYNLALIYQVVGQDSNAVDIFRKGLVWWIRIRIGPCWSCNIFRIW